MSMHRGGPGGFTLVELMVTLTLLGILFGMVGLAPDALTPPDEAAIPRQAAAAQREAIRSGHPVTVTLASVSVTFYPDASATPARLWDGEAYWSIDPWTGEVRRE